MPADWSQEKGMGVVHRNYNLKTTPARGYQYGMVVQTSCPGERIVLQHL